MDVLAGRYGFNPATGFPTATLLGLLPSPLRSRLNFFDGFPSSSIYFFLYIFFAPSNNIPVLWSLLDAIFFAPLRGPEIDIAFLIEYCAKFWGAKNIASVNLSFNKKERSNSSAILFSTKGGTFFYLSKKKSDCRRSWSHSDLRGNPHLGGAIPFRFI